MIKGFICFRQQKIPYVIENNCMELFSDEEILHDFCKYHNFRYNYTLQGQYFREGSQGEKAEFLVEHSIGSTCYLKCYILYALSDFGEYDTIGFQSPFLDTVFRYEYSYLELSRSGKNLAIAPLEVYRIPFSMNSNQYELVYKIGYDNRLGILEDHSRRGELLLKLQKKQINECSDISLVLYRLAMFITSYAAVPYKRIVLYKNGIRSGWFYCPLIKDDESFVPFSLFDTRFMNFDVMKYIPKILNNIAQDSGQKVSKSIPLGHFMRGNSRYSPQRFMEQVMAFEYLFDKIDPSHAQDRRFPLKSELEQMFNEFPQILSGGTLSSNDVSEKIKNTRHSIAHGHEYYYEFENSSEFPYLMILLDKLIQNMSLQWIGFNKTEISQYPIY